jgi:hypothetical protein
MKNEFIRRRINFSMSSCPETKDDRQIILKQRSETH